MQIRKADLKDKDQLVKLLCEFDNQAQRYLPEEHAKFRRYVNLEKAMWDEVEGYFSSGALVFVAEENGVVVGFIAGSL